MPLAVISMFSGIPQNWSLDPTEKAVQPPTYYLWLSTKKYNETPAFETQKKPWQILASKSCLFIAVYDSQTFKVENEISNIIELGWCGGHHLCLPPLPSVLESP